MAFRYNEDFEFFRELFGNYYNESYFDFRSPEIKRLEFNKLRNDVFKLLTNKYGLTCRLNFKNICDDNSGYVVDHLIPLSSNELNKKLRKMIASNSKKKVPSESYGSNDICNLVIACNKCNNHKKHKIMSKRDLRAILEVMLNNY